MSVQELEKDSLLTSNSSAEISLLQGLTEVSLAPTVGRNSRLEGTGFNLRLELVRLYNNYNQNLRDGKDVQEALMLAASESEFNIRTFVVEYIQSKTILPHVNRIQEIEGKYRMVGQNGVSVISGITSAERYGATLAASIKVEDFLTNGGLQKAPNRVAVMNSPLGHSGLIDANGNSVNYKSNQTMVFWTDQQGDLHGLTIVSDLNQAQSRQLSIDLGIDQELLTGDTTEREVANIMANPALFSYSKSFTNPAKHVFEKILAIRGSSDIRLEQADGQIEYRSVVQTWEDIEKFDSLLQFNDTWERLLRKFRQTLIINGRCLNQLDAQLAIAKTMEETILDIAVNYLEIAALLSFDYVSEDHPTNYQSAYSNLVPYPADADNYARATAFLQSRGGCNGGGKNNRTTLRGSSLNSEGTTVGKGNSLEVDEYGSLYFECPHADCGKINKREKGELRETCQHCGKTIPRC